MKPLSTELIDYQDRDESGQHHEAERRLVSER